MNEKIKIYHFQKEIKSQLLHSGADLVGFADLGNAELRSAISVGISYDAKIVDRLDSEIDAFERHLMNLVVVFV